MNKKLIVAAVAAAVVAPAAFAEVEVYGKAHAQIGMLDNDANDGDFWTVDRDNSHVGFRGSDDLGNGMKGIFQLETSFETDTGGIGGSGRDSFVGLEGDFGWVALGRHNSPYKMATNSMDIAGDTVIDYNAIMGRSPGDLLHDERVSNAVRFKSKDMNGLGIDVLWGVKDADSNAPTGTTNPAQTDAHTIALGVAYKQGPIEVAAAYDNLGEQGTVVSGKPEDDVAAKIGGKFFFMDNQAWVAAIYETIDAGGTDRDRTGYYVSGLFKAGQWAFGAGYGMADDVGNASDSGATLMQLQAKHSLSKATNWYAQYGVVDVDKSTTGGQQNLYGLRNGGFLATAADKSATYFGVGIQSDFSSK